MSSPTDAPDPGLNPSPPPPQSTPFGQRPFVRELRAVGSWAIDAVSAMTWWRFFLFALLIIIAGGMFSSLLPDSAVDRPGKGEKLHFDIKLDEKGVQVSPSRKKGGGVVGDFKEGLEEGFGGASAPRSKDGTVEIVTGDNAKGKPKGKVSIDSSGVHIESDKDGKKTTVRIDSSGVHVDKDRTTPAAGAASGQGAAQGAQAPVPPEPPVAPGSSKPQRLVIAGVDLTEDDATPERIREIVDQVRDEVEDAVNDQLDKEVSRRVRQRSTPASEFVMPMVLLMIMMLMIVKVLAGGKRKAEVKAMSATRTAESESLRRQLAEARIQTMQAQVEPHFLFNTLASVDYLIETDPRRASSMQKNLIQYLRASLPQMREQATNLGREVSLVRSYLEILKVRMDERLNVEIQVPDGLSSAGFPPMMLQTLVENAIKHGLEPKPEGGTLRVSAEVAHGKLRVTVADTGMGFQPRSATSGDGLGLSNVRERLALLYPRTGQLVIAPNQPSGTVATIEIPYQTAPAAAAPAPGGAPTN